MAMPRTRSRLAGILLCGVAMALFLCPPASAQRQLSFPSGGGNNRPSGNRPGGTGELWPGAGGNGQQPSSGGSQTGEFWPGAGPSSTTTTRRPSGPAAGCNCPSTPEYNPVCGTDGVSYGNPGKLNCAKYCGRNVSILHYGNCTPPDPNAPTTTPSTTTTTRRRRP